MPATLEDAIILAADRHRGQTDKAGRPYILHPLRVMHSLGLAASADEQMTAALHDVVEDTETTLDDLRRRGFPEAVVRAVDSVTKRPEEKADYFAAIRRARADPIGRKVKIADITDNLDLGRLPAPSREDLERAARYREALAMLSAGA